MYLPCSGVVALCIALFLASACLVRRRFCGIRCAATLKKETPHSVSVSDVSECCCKCHRSHGNGGLHDAKGELLHRSGNSFNDESSTGGRGFQVLAEGDEPESLEREEDREEIQKISTSEECLEVVHDLEQSEERSNEDDSDKHKLNDLDITDEQSLHEENRDLPRTESFSFGGCRAEGSSFQLKKMVREELSGYACTGCSATNSSRDWRSSCQFRDSVTEAAFSSSSRRSTSQWETYTAYKRYEEELISLDKMTTQKLNETESIRSLGAKSRSFRRIMADKMRNGQTIRSPYQELEAAYVAQVCLAWETLGLCYKNLLRLKLEHHPQEPRCTPRIARELQQFHVLLHRFIETEPFEQGNRPEIYARWRLSAPPLLKVPDFQDAICEKPSSNDASGEGEVGDDDLRVGKETMISLQELLFIVKDCIRAFMIFLKADKTGCCGKFRHPWAEKQGSADPLFLRFLLQANRTKKKQIKHIQRSRRCMRKKRVNEETEMEIVMSKIDLMLVSRVMRMSDVSEVQLRWCEDKMCKVRVWRGKLQRDTFPLILFPAR